MLLQKLIDIRKSLQIHSNIEIIYLEKTEEHENIANPKYLIEFANLHVNKRIIPFDKNHDKLIIVFDLDIFETQQDNLKEILSLSEKYNILGVTNPSFELFLLLHNVDSIEKIITPNQVNIIKNQWVGSKYNRRRFIDDLFRKEFNMNPKKNSQIGELAINVKIAIEQEKNINHDVNDSKGKITSNIGKIIQAIIDDCFSD